ncbi:Tir chaperone protein (CesT) [Cedecea lapagei]|uniref:Tir chaperone n=1 Tax=Cedecea lapagei TaxID=158823 RepID=A0A447V4Z5_9ENTR|nr:CesT family type III secretion system chaperone [Cedecea lapagei]VEB99334.1 Tir chaperone protein (CesT) [Cedecea lapagei]
MVIAEQLYHKLQPLFKQLNVPSMALNPQGYYSLTLDGGQQVFLELTENMTLVMMGMLALPEQPGEALLLELLQANLNIDQQPAIIVAADKDRAQLVVWASLPLDGLHLDTLLPLFERLSWTLSVIGRWCQPVVPRQRLSTPEAQKDRLQRHQVEALMSRR